MPVPLDLGDAQVLSPFKRNPFWLLFGPLVASFLPFVGMMGCLVGWLRQ